MSEKLVKSVASTFRSLPHFKGKFRLGKAIQKLFLPSNEWKNPEFFIRLKNGIELFIDVRSKTHIVPFWIGKRDQSIISLIEKNSAPDSTILDVGANIGYYAIPLAYHLKNKNVEVHAFEPVTANFKSLEKGIKRNGLTENLKANKIALGDKKGKLEIIKTEAGNTGNAVISFGDDEFKKEAEKEEIEMITLDDYAHTNKLRGCDFIKIDIEGAEIFFIQGGVETFKKFKPIIYGEFNSFFIRKFGFSVEDVWAILEPIGYEAYIEHPSQHGKFSKTSIKKGMENLLFVPKERDASKWLN